VKMCPAFPSALALPRVSNALRSDQSGSNQFFPDIFPAGTSRVERSPLSATTGVTVFLEPRMGERNAVDLAPGLCHRARRNHSP